jgi:hypothetical protein
MNDLEKSRVHAKAFEQELDSADDAKSRLVHEFSERVNDLETRLNASENEKDSLSERIV